MQSHSLVEIFRVYVPSYALPNFQELEKVYAKGWVGAIFDGREWTRDPACEGVDETPGEREMWLYTLPEDTETDSIIEEKVTQGFYPTLPVEAVAFVSANPEILRQLWFIALGASALDDGNRFVPYFDRCGNKHILLGDYRSSRWRAGRHLLFTKFTPADLARRAAQGK